MRKNFFIASVAISAITLFIACAGGTTGTTETTEEAKEKDFNTLISEGDFAEAHAILQAEIKNRKEDLAHEWHCKEAAIEIYSMADMLYKEWILDVMSTNTENPEIAVIQLLTAYPILGEKKEGGLQDYSYYKNPFVNGTLHYNQLCDKVFATALLSKQFDIAESIVDAYMEDINVVEGHYGLKVHGVVMDGNHSYVEYSTKSQTEARKKLEEARKNSK